MLMPKRVKYRKHQRGRRKGIVFDSLQFGRFGLQAMEPAWITARQIEACRVAVVRHVKKGAKLWIRIFPDKSVTKKPAETRMGKGKGDVAYWVAVVKRGRVLFELDGVTKEQAEEVFRIVAHKLPIKVKFIQKDEIA